ncbi:MAG: endolytic transglycosylase MltG, partial [Firmicutes bacterium]|nr:endolytic transglycosylase MltG [Bacillota bacterium]
DKAEKKGDKDILSEYSQMEIVTVASLIEREAKLDDERADVSSVVYNRLDKGMKLQFCSTVQYALGKVKARLYNSDLQIQSPYNTYLYEGLPPGPIASPGKASIEAAMNPNDTDYLYFVVSSKGDGSHNFASTGDDFSAYRDDYLSSLTDS